MKWIKYAFYFVMLSIIILPCVLVVIGSSTAFSDREIAIYAKRLNEAAAIQIPHFFLMEDEKRQNNLALLERVEAGVPLDAGESETYRALFQDTLLDGQGFLSRFDAELTILHDAEMQHLNNVSSLGIKGNHDHHDVSARLNYADVERALSRLNNASGLFAPLVRIRAVNLAQKSLADVISHMGVAPHTISVAYQKPNRVWEQEKISGTFEEMMQAYKSSQFESVNSVGYWEQIDRAVALYAKLVGQVQKRLWQKSAWWERRIAGRFLDLQTLAPQISEDISYRKR